MKPLLLIPLVLFVVGCAKFPAGGVDVATDEATPPAEACIGDTALPASLEGKFEPIDDLALLNNALGDPTKGGLCQGQVYQAKAGQSIILYRAWNSTNPHSQMGRWWAAEIPDGKTADYREDYEICYQWSPLDKLTRCDLAPGAKVVVGTGQSAECSQYLTYGVSASKQVYIENAADFMSNCDVFDDNFNWQAAN